MTRPAAAAAALVCSLFLVAPAPADELTVERIYDSPSLSGPRPRGVQISPDGSRVSFLKGKESDMFQFDLWEYDVASGATRLLVDSERILDEPEELSEEEKGRRERARIAAFRGIVGYDWSPTGAMLLFPMGGDVFVYDLEKEGGEAARKITDTEAFETDARFSPRGRWISYVRDQDLYAYNLEEGREHRLTDDGGGVIKNGMAEFVAQEEMRRNTGYWWSHDESRIAYIRVDESPVDVTDRFEVYADQVKIIPQRYPWTGTPNVKVRLFVREMASGKVTEMDLGPEEDIYIFRVSWFPDGRHLAVSRQPRDLQSLDLLKYDTDTGRGRRLIQESSSTWIEVEHLLEFLPSTRELIWASHRDGFVHLYLYDWEGNLKRRLTSGDWVVRTTLRRGTVFRVDEKARRIYFVANKETPLEYHLYGQSLDTADPSSPGKITTGHGVHDVAMERKADIYVGTFSSPTQPPQVGIYRMDGTRLAWLEENALDESHPYHPYLEGHITPEFGTLQASDGQTLHYRIHKPAGFDPAGKYPAIVYVYGGPMGQRVTRAWGSMWTQLWARRGYAIFELDNRGTGYRGQAFDAPIHLQLGKAEVEDQLRGVEYLKSLPWVDRDRVGVYGWSYGGYMSLMLLFKAPEGTFRAGIAGAPVTDYRLYDTYYTERYLGRPDANAEGYEKTSVIPLAKNLSSELLLVHGMADDNVLFTNSTMLVKELQDQGRLFQAMFYPGGKHGVMGFGSAGKHGLRTMTRFWDRHLKP